jgi:hypothetical protein
VERFSVKSRLVLTGVAIAILIVGAVIVMRVRAQRAIAAGTVVPDDLRAPPGQRIRVQVFNATKTRGLARRATMLLRDRGFDVVEMGTLSAPRDSTLILDLSGHPEWANRVAAIFGGAPVQARRDSSRYLDVAVLIGASWRPPTEPFYP